jgi:hypothetical protein
MVELSERLNGRYLANCLERALEKDGYRVSMKYGKFLGHAGEADAQYFVREGIRVVRGVKRFSRWKDLEVSVRIDTEEFYTSLLIKIKERTRLPIVAYFWSHELGKEDSHVESLEKRFLAEIR